MKMTKNILSKSLYQETR